MKMLAGLSPAGALRVRAGQAAVLRYVPADADRAPQSVEGSSCVLVLRRTNSIMPILTIEGFISGDGMYFTFPISAQQASEIYEIGVIAGLAYDIVETTQGGSTIRLTARISVEAGPALEDEIVPVWEELPVSQVLLRPDTIVVSELGARGKSAATQAYDEGLIDDPTSAALAAKLSAMGQESADALASDLSSGEPGKGADQVRVPPPPFATVAAPMTVGDHLMAGDVLINSLLEATDTDFTNAFNKWGAGTARNVMAPGAGANGDQRYPVSDEIVNSHGGQIIGRRQTLGGFSISNMNGRSFNMNAQSVYRIAVASSEKSAGADNFGFFFEQPNTSDRSALLQYPWAIKLQNVARACFGGTVRIEKAWKGIDASGNTGGLDAGIMEICAFEVGAQINGALDFVRGHFHLWPFGLVGLESMAIYRDMIARQMLIGTCDGLDISVSAFRARLCFFRNALLGRGASGAMRLQADTLGARIEGACKSMAVDVGFKTSGDPGDFLMAATGGIWMMSSVTAAMSPVSGGVGEAQFVGSINGFTLSVSAIVSGKPSIGHKLSGTGIAADTYIAGHIYDDNGVITALRVSVSQTVASTTISATGAPGLIQNFGAYVSVGDVIAESGAPDAPIYHQVNGIGLVGKVQSLYGSNTVRTKGLVRFDGTVGRLSLDGLTLPGIGTGSGPALEISVAGGNRIAAGPLGAWGCSLPASLASGDYTIDKLFTATPTVGFADANDLVTVPGTNFSTSYKIIHSRIVGTFWLDWSGAFATASGALQIKPGAPYAPAEDTGIRLAAFSGIQFSHTSGFTSHISTANIVSLRYPVSGGSSAYIDHLNCPSGGTYAVRAAFDYRAA